MCNKLMTTAGMCRLLFSATWVLLWHPRCAHVKLTLLALLAIQAAT
jgi:hypothetical protein